MEVEEWAVFGICGESRGGLGSDDYIRATWDSFLEVSTL